MLQQKLVLAVSPQNFAPELVNRRWFGCVCFPSDSPRWSSSCTLVRWRVAHVLPKPDWVALAGAGGEVAAQTSEAAGQAKPHKRHGDLLAAWLRLTFANTMKYFAGKLVVNDRRGYQDRCQWFGVSNGKRCGYSRRKALITAA
jgi:hypothetical protein